MGSINRTANGHQTSLLVAQHVPQFVIKDHPKFVTFIEKYYEFMANNTVLSTANSDVYYYGADTASKMLQDISDIDLTDLDQFVESFQKEYAYTFPQKIYSASNRATLLKNLIQFYQAVGTEDSFRMLFRLLYNEEIEFYYPKKDILIASGGEFVTKARIQVNYVENLNQIENKMIVGATSGAYGTVEGVHVLPYGSDTFITGQIESSSAAQQVPFSSGISAFDPSANVNIHDSMRQLEHGGHTAFVYMTDFFGDFDFFEDVYYSDGGSANTTVAANTTVLPMMKQLMWFNSFGNYATPNNMISLHDARMQHKANSTNPPWGSANISFQNTGMWHTTGFGTGELKLVNTNFGSTGEVQQRVLEVGNNNVATANGDLRHFVLSHLIGVRGEDRLYRMSIRARDLGGNSAYSVAAGNRFSAGISAVRHDMSVISAADGYIVNSITSANAWHSPFWFVSHKQSLDDKFYTYIGYFGGREKTQSTGNPYLEKNHGSGGRVDLPSGNTRQYNSAQKAVNKGVLLPFNTTYIVPTFKVNEPANGASYSQGITQIDYVSIDELTAMQKQLLGKGNYKEDSSLLSSSSYLQDAYYWQNYAYDIRSRVNMSGVDGYGTVVRESVHPAGMKMFGTHIYESNTTVGVVSVNGLVIEPDGRQAEGEAAFSAFSPDQFDSLAGWWKADAIGSESVQWKQWSPEITSSGIYGTNTNRWSAGASSFEDSEYNVANTFTANCIVEITSNNSYIGEKSLKITDWHISTNPQFSLSFNSVANTDSNSTYYHNQFIDDYFAPVVIEPYKKWLWSMYAKVSNTVWDGNPASTTNSFRTHFLLANTTFGIANSVGTHHFRNFDAADTWQRLSVVLDGSANPETRAIFRPNLADRSAFNQATGNTVYHIDGLMLEEYDPAIHGTYGSANSDGSGNPYAPSTHVLPGMSGANVLSWSDQSPNEHHVHANTHGGIFYPPQFVANAINGMPAVRFSANTVKNTTNVYSYSSIGGIVNATALELGDSSAFRLPTSGLQATRTLSVTKEDALPRGVSNTWTIMTVVKTNLDINATSYDTTLNPTIFNSGYAGNKDSLDSGAGSITGTMTLGYDVVGESGAVLTNVVNNTPGIVSVNTSAVTTFVSKTSGISSSSPSTESSFRIVGVSVNASTGSSGDEDLLNFHLDGRRFANSEINNILQDLSYTGMDYLSQNNYVTSIGKWKAANNTSNSLNDVTNTYLYGTADWDGDIAEILVYNEKLSNTKIALVEGYLAHKYGLQTNLKHKDDDGDGSPEIETRRWEFANTQDGWNFYVEDANGASIQTLAPSTGHVFYVWEGGDSNNYIHVAVKGHSVATGNLVMKQSMSPYIIGAAYDKFAIRFNAISGLAATRAGYLTFKTSGGTSCSFISQTLSSYGAGWHEHHVDLSGESLWTGNTIKELKYVFDQDPDGLQRYYVDYVYVSGNNHPHPYRWNAPSSMGANGWNLNY